MGASTSGLGAGASTGFENNDFAGAELSDLGAPKENGKADADAVPWLLVPMPANGLSLAGFPIFANGFSVAGFPTLANGLATGLSPFTGALSTAGLPILANGFPFGALSLDLSSLDEPNEKGIAPLPALAGTPMFANGDAPSRGLGGGVDADDDGLPHLGTSGSLISGLLAARFANGFLISGIATLATVLSLKNEGVGEAGSLAGAGNESTGVTAGLAWTG